MEQTEIQKRESVSTILEDKFTSAMLPEDGIDEILADTVLKEWNPNLEGFLHACRNGLSYHYASKKEGRGKRDLEVRSTNYGVRVDMLGVDVFWIKDANSYIEIHDIIKDKIKSSFLAGDYAYKLNYLCSFFEYGFSTEPALFKEIPDNEEEYISVAYNISMRNCKEAAYFLHKDTLKKVYNVFYNAKVNDGIKGLKNVASKLSSSMGSMLISNTCFSPSDKNCATIVGKELTIEVKTMGVTLSIGNSKYSIIQIKANYRDEKDRYIITKNKRLIPDTIKEKIINIYGCL